MATQQQINRSKSKKVPEQEHLLLLPPRIRNYGPPLTNEQLHEILSTSVRDLHLQDLREVVIIVANTGISSEELVNFRYADVDIKKRRIKVRSKRAGDHFIPFAAETLKILEARRNREPKSEYVLGVNARRLLNRVSRQLRALGQTIGIGSVTINSLRQTFGMRLMNSGASIDSLKTIWGLEVGELKFSTTHKQRFIYASRDQARVESPL